MPLREAKPKFWLMENQAGTLSDSHGEARTRTIKVGCLYPSRPGGGRSPSPFIRLSGKWLEKAGFCAGNLVEVRVAAGRLELTRFHVPTLENFDE